MGEKDKLERIAFFGGEVKEWLDKTLRALRILKGVKKKKDDSG